MKVVTGDLIDMAKAGEFDVIIHGCNCFCTMGRGIAKQIKAEFPEAYREDQKTVKGDLSKLGKITYVTYEDEDSTLHVVNVYTQFNYTGAKILADYAAIAEAMRVVKHTFPGLRIGYPKIGAGLAGGNWDIIAKIIDEVLEGEDHTLVIWDKA